MKTKYLVTGAAGFIGFHLTKRLLEKNGTVVGIDNLNDYYDVGLKLARLRELGIEQPEFEYGKIVRSPKYPRFRFIKTDIADKKMVDGLFSQYKFSIVCNLAAQAGVIYSTVNPNAYIHSNITGFANILECCREYNAKLVYASSSSVYGANEKLPFSETDPIRMPKNLYAKTKINNEYLAQIYSDHLGLHATGLRFFSVYGTYGRPDMVMTIFAEALLNRLPLIIYGDGNMKRDYTFVTDVVTAIEKIIDYGTRNKMSNEIFNIGSSRPVSLLELIEKMETVSGLSAIRSFMPMRKEEIETTYADSSKLKKVIGYKPDTSIDAGIKQFIDWYISRNNNDKIR